MTDDQPGCPVSPRRGSTGRCYRVTFSDGTSIVADAEHEWLTDTRASRKSAQSAAAKYNGHRNQRTFAEVRTTREIAESVRCATKDQRLNHSVSNAAAIDLPERVLPLPPYVLGVWLGDGTSAAAHFTSADPEIAAYVEGEGIDAPFLGNQRYGLQLPSGDDFGALLRTMGVLGNKHVPAAYLRASERQRRDLLAGLLDTDGTVTSNGNVQFTTTSQVLADGVFELIVSLGYRCSISPKKVNGRTKASSTAYNLNFSTHDPVFRLHRKEIAHKERTRHQSNARRMSRFITRVERVASVPVRCIEVDNASHMYLAGRAMVPTHNSTLGVDIARSASIRHGLTSVIFSLEMSRNEIVMRLLSAEAQVPLHHMRAGTMSDSDWTKLARQDGRGQRRSAVHRRLAQHDADGDPREVPATQAAS